MGIGFYDDARYRTLQELTTSDFGILKTASLAGTGTTATTLGYPLKVLRPFRVVNANAYFVAGGTEATAVRKVRLVRSLAGTGDDETLAELIIGTQANGTFRDLTTYPDIEVLPGDTVTIKRLAGTSAIVADVTLQIGIREQFTL